MIPRSAPAKVNEDCLPTRASIAIKGHEDTFCLLPSLKISRSADQGRQEHRRAWESKCEVSSCNCLAKGTAVGERASAHHLPRLRASISARPTTGPGCGTLPAPGFMARHSGPHRSHQCGGVRGRRARSACLHVETPKCGRGTGNIVKLTCFSSTIPDPKKEVRLHA